MTRSNPLPAWLGKLLCLLAVAISPAAAGEMSRIVAAEGKGYLEQVGDQHVLHVAGTPYEMGWQHGRLCRDEFRAWCRYLGGGEWVRDLPARRLRCYLPKSVLEEIHGLADGAGIDRTTALRVQHALTHLFPNGPSRSVAAWGTSTADGGLYHAQALYSLHLTGDQGWLRGTRLLLVAKPAGCIPYVCTTWQGFVGAPCGMNAEGISVTAALTCSRDETDRGLPAHYLVRKVLGEAHTLDEAVATLRTSARTGACSYIMGDSKVPAAVVVETTRSLCEVMGAGDPAAATSPHVPIPDLVQCGVQFAHPATAATQQEWHVAGDKILWPMSWSYSQALINDRRRLDTRRLMVSFLDRGQGIYPVALTVLDLPHHAVWLRQLSFQPLEDRVGWLYGYSTSELLGDRRFQRLTGQPPTPRPRPTLGVCECADTLKPLSDPDPEVNKLLARYNFPATPFPWEMRLVQETDKYSVHRLLFPSPAHFEMLEARTVHAEYYIPRPVPRGARAILIYHILADGFVVARLIARNFAAAGHPCLVMHMPFYGRRRPRGTSFARTMLAEPQRMFESMWGAVPEARRALCWLQKRPEVAPDRIGLIGVSLGAIVGGVIAGVDPRIDRTVLVIGGGDPAAILWNAPETQAVRALFTEMGLTLDSLREAIAGLDAVRFAHRIDPKRVLMINARFDKTVPRECTMKLWEALRRPTIQWYPVGHYSIGTLTPVILSTAFNFFRDAPAQPPKK